jgi:hypothetical protein
VGSSECIYTSSYDGEEIVAQGPARRRLRSGRLHDDCGLTHSGHDAGEIEVAPDPPDCQRAEYYQRQE